MLSILLFFLIPTSIAKNSIPNYDTITPQDLKRLALVFPEPREDSFIDDSGKTGKSGFMIAGKNQTSTIKSLKYLRGKKIDYLENLMRPYKQVDFKKITSKSGSTPTGTEDRNKVSNEGFLGVNDKLLEVLARDNDIVMQHRFTHQVLGRHLIILGAIGHEIGAKSSPVFISYLGHRIKILVYSFTKVGQPSPFGDSDWGYGLVEVENLENGESIRYSPLVAWMIYRYGFYEGAGTPFRLPPEKVIKVFEFSVPG